MGYGEELTIYIWTNVFSIPIEPTCIGAAPAKPAAHPRELGRA